MESESEEKEPLTFNLADKLQKLREVGLTHPDLEPARPRQVQNNGRNRDKNNGGTRARHSNIKEKSKMNGGTPIENNGQMNQTQPAPHAGTAAMARGAERLADEVTRTPKLGDVAKVVGTGVGIAVAGTLVGIAFKRLVLDRFLPLGGAIDTIES